MFLIIQIIGFILAGSFSAFFGLFFGLGTIITLVLCNDYTKLTLLLVTLIIFITFFGILFLRSGDLFQNKTSVIQREQQYKEALEISNRNNNFIWGVGIGNYVNSLDNLEFEWQKQPVHNVFILILTENGIIGVVLFAIAMVLIFKENLLALSVLPILMLDHYCYTIQQGMLVFVCFIILSMLFKEIVKNRKNSFLKSENKEKLNNNVSFV